MAGFEGQSRATALAIYLVLTHVASAQHHPEEARAFVGTLAALSGLGPSTIRRYLHRFEELGLLTVERSMIGGRLNDMNRYLLISPSTSGRGAVTRPGQPHSTSGRGTPTGGSQPQEQIQEEENHQQAAAVAEDDPLLDDLIREGVDPRTAAALLASAGPDAVDGWLSVDAWRTGRNPVGVLIAHLRRGDPPPPPPETTWERYRRARGARGAD